MSNSEYHADRTADSWTTLKTFHENPILYFDQYIKNLPRKKPTDDMLKGSMAHTLIANEEPWWVPCPHKKNTKKYKAFAAEHPGVEIVSEAWDSAAKAMRDGVMNNPQSRRLIESSAYCEESIFWTDERTGLPLKFRMDIGTFDYLADFKFTGLPAKTDFSRQLFKQLWYRQAAHYSVGFKAAYKVMPEFFFVATRNEYPFESYVHRVPPTVIQEGIACNRVTLKALAAAKAEKNFMPEGWGVVNDCDLAYWAYEHVSGG
jgi:hypothetical protein